jgi:outer membrane protein TolC
LSLEEAIELAVAHNFDVQISRMTPEINSIGLWGSYGAYDPKFTVGGNDAYARSGGGFNQSSGIYGVANQTYGQTYDGGFNGLLPFGTTYSLNASSDHYSSIVPGNPQSDQYNTSAGISLTQPLLKNLWTDSSRTTIAIAKNTIKGSEFDFRYSLLNIVSKTEINYYELICAYENIKVQEKALELAKRLAAENKRKVELGAMAKLDEKQAESQAATSEAALIQAYGQLSSQQNILKTLITDRYSEWHTVDIVPSQKLIAMPEKFDVQESWRKGITKRPDLLSAKTSLESRGITLRYQKNQVFPQLDLVATYGRNGMEGSWNPAVDDIDNNRLPYYSVGGRLTIPLSNRSARSAVRQTKAQMAQDTVRVKQLEQTILISIDDAIKAANTYYQTVQATHAAREYAEQALDAEQKKFEVGKSTSFQVLQLQKDLTSARLYEIRALANYNQALATVAANEGTTLEKHKLNVMTH